MREEILLWLKDWFGQRSALPDNAESANYFEIGLIDSIGVIELIEAIENKFALKFSHENFQDKRFSSIEGLATIIQEIKQNQ